MTNIAEYNKKIFEKIEEKLEPLTYDIIYKNGKISQVNLKHEPTISWKDTKIAELDGGIFYGVYKEIPKGDSR